MELAESCIRELKIISFEKVKTNLKKILPLLALSFIPTLAIWIPFLFRLKSFWSIPLPQTGMATIVANYDGPLYLAVAKTFYNPELIKASFSFPLSTEYYASHFPLFPALIRALSPLVGFPYAMLVLTSLSSFLAIFFFYKFISLFSGEKNAFFLTFIFSILPARWLIVRSVGSAEPLFIAAIIASMFYFQKKRYLLAGVWGAVAQLTKSPGIILFFAYSAAIVAPHAKKLATTNFRKWLKLLKLKNVYPITLIPISLLLVFTLYGITFGDFFAYFNSGDNIHLFFPPFQIFNYSAPWVGTFWLEEIIFVYLFGVLGVLKLVRMKKPALAWFTGLFFFSTIFVSHRDLIRYSLPIVPFLIAAFSKTISNKDFKIVIAVLAIPIYLFSLAYISQNVMPISNWAPFL